MMLKSHSVCPFGCGSSDAYSEKQTDSGVFGKCFSCGKSKGNGGLSSEYAAKYTPLPYNNSITVHTHRDYGIAKFESKEINGHTYYDFVYLPCYLDDEFLGMQIKRPGREPKYLTFKNDSLIYYTKQKTEHCDTLVITEDWFSAIACGRNEGIEALALTGTDLTRHSHLYKFIREIAPNHIIVWLDYDKAGFAGAKKVSKLLENTYSVYTVVSKQEPKQLKSDELRRRLLLACRILTHTK